MASDFEEKKQRAYTNRRSVMDLGMGIMYAGVGAILCLSGVLKLGIDFSGPVAYVFGGLCVLYGGFRIYRGIKRDYFQE